MAALVSICTFYFPLLLVLHATAALQWSQTPQDGDTLYICANHNVTLDWSFTLDPGDVVLSTVWNFRGRVGEEMVAASIGGNFLPTPTFSHRVTLLPNAGILLSHATKAGDAGNFSVTVTGHDSSGVSFTSRRSVLVQVGDDLMTTDHKLHVEQQPEVEHSNATDQWHAVLTCGRFTYASDPPVSVEWLTPEGKTLPSTLYAGGFFKLFLDNPVRDGTYACRMSPSAAEASCAGHGASGEQVTAVVNGLTTRLALLEAEQQRLRAESGRKDAVIGRLTVQVDALRANASRVESEVERLSSCCQNNSPTPTVAFSARLHDNVYQGQGQALILSKVLLNAGDAYDAGTGRFTAPLNGTYFFTAMAAAYGPSHFADLSLRSDSAAMGDYVFNAYAFNGEDGRPRTGSLQGAVRLQRGEQVWLTSITSGAYYWSVAPTVFSGFLLFVG